MEDFKTIKEFIELNLRKGDVTAIVTKAGKTQPLFASAMRKEEWSSLTDSEKTIIKTARAFLRQRKTKEEKALEKMAKEL